jgi:hypothetical protein
MDIVTAKIVLGVLLIIAPEPVITTIIGFVALASINLLKKNVKTTVDVSETFG